MPNRMIDLGTSLPAAVVLVIADPSGVTYRNQAGGVTCAQPELEGVLAPLALDDADHDRIMKLSYGYGHLTEELAYQIDEVLAGSPATRPLRVDRTRLNESMEAWVFVVTAVEEIDGQDFESVAGFGRITGALTWPNSD